MVISIDRYQELIHIPICAFNGVNKPDEQPNYGCGDIWTRTMRENIATYLAQAQEMREQELGFFLNATYTVEELDDTTANPHILSAKQLIALGKKVETLIASYTLVHRTIYNAIVDPVIITQAVDVSIDLAYLRVYKRDGDGVAYPVLPTSMRFEDGNAIIKIPRARLVDPAYDDDRENPLDYDDDDVFASTVDLVYEYPDASQAILYFWHEPSKFAETTQTGYGIIRDTRLSIIDAYPASWANSVASPVVHISSYWHRSHLRVSYLSGRINPSYDLQTIRLAHTLMPYEPCHCEPVHMYWQNDVTKDDGNPLTPYGQSNAAVDVWIKDSRSKIGTGYTIGKGIK
jgi:hypothetical protein